MSWKILSSSFFKLSLDSISKEHGLHASNHVFERISSAHLRWQSWISNFERLTSMSRKYLRELRALMRNLVAKKSLTTLPEVVSELIKMMSSTYTNRAMKNVAVHLVNKLNQLLIGGSQIRLEMRKVWFSIGKRLVADHRGFFAVDIHCW